MDTVRTALIERQVAAQDVTNMAGIKHAGFNDPDGNPWGLASEFMSGMCLRFRRTW